MYVSGVVGAHQHSPCLEAAYLLLNGVQGQPVEVPALYSDLA